MATAKAAPAKKAPAKKAAAKRAPVKKTAAKKTTAAKGNVFSLKQSADKALNVYLGLIGKTVDAVQENMDTVRKDNEQRVKDLEKRGAKLRKALNKRFDSIEVPEFDEVVDDAKAQFDKISDQIEDVVENAKDKLTTKKAA